jgi:anti-sigma B factor antagonist
LKPDLSAHPTQTGGPELRSTPQPFAVSVEPNQGSPVVRVTGELDVATAPRLQQELQALSGSAPALVTLDLAETEFIDSTGLRAIVVAVKELRASGGDLVVRSPSPSTARLLEISGLSAVVRVA